MPLTPDVSRIDEIIDQSALLAQQLVPKVSAVWGAGSGKVVDPLLTAKNGGVTQYIRPADAKVVAPFSHVSDLPPAPRLAYRSATVCEIFWEIPMRLYLAPNDEATARRVAVQFYARYITAFASRTQLNGTVQSALITAYRQFIETDVRGGKNWYGLEMTLTAIERLNLELQP